MGSLIDREQLRALTAQGAQLVEVLPAEEYREEHLPGALSIPLTELDRESAGALDPRRTVIVYCWDSAWDLAPRAAARLEQLGFTDVREFRAGKHDWLAAGLPSEGENVARPTAGSVAKKDPPAYSPTQRVGDIDRSLGAAVVVDGDRVVLGMLRAAELAADPNARLEDVMRNGPSTFRPNVPIKEVADYMTEHDLESAPITTSDGRLVGVLFREDAVRASS